MVRTAENVVLKQAVKYSELGWEVIPLAENKKIPLTSHGFKDSTTDQLEIEELFKNPNCNIGIRVGPESNLVVLDIDDKSNKSGSERLKELEIQLGKLPTTLTVRTQNGHHYYFSFPEKWNESQIKKELAPGVDLKTKGGYVVAPPSKIDNFQYHIETPAEVAELPKDWVNEALKEYPIDWTNVQPLRGSGKLITEEYGLKMEDVIDLPPNARRGSDNSYLIKHPVHGASGEGNLSVSLSKNLWHCFRCSSGGDALSWVAVREHFVDCADAGRLDRETIKKCLQVLRSEGLVPEESTIRETVSATKPDGTTEEYTIVLRKLDDVANVERFMSRHANDLRYCIELNRWREYNGKYWKDVSVDIIKRYARDVAAIIRKESALIEELNMSDAEKTAMVRDYERWARNSSQRRSLEAIVDLSKADLGVSTNDFDADPYLSNCENGTFDIRNGQLNPHRRMDYITKYRESPYERGFKDERWDAFLDKVQPTKAIRNFLWRAAGYSMTGVTNQEALFFCFGDRSTGKSTFLAAMLSAAATYGTTSKFATFLADRSASGGSPREDVARLIGSRITICNEVNKGTKFNSALLKTLVSGEQYVARVPYSPTSIEFDPVFKLWLSANDRPEIEYDDMAAFRRFYVVPFDVPIPVKEQDRSLRSVFKHDPDMKKAILAWALEGAVEWYKVSDGGKDDGLQAPKEVVSATEVYQLAMNPLYSFIQAECEIGCDATGNPFEEGAIELWDAYDNPHAHYDIKAVKSSKSLGKYLSALGFERYREKVGTRQYKWKYLRLLEAYEVPGMQPRSSACPMLKQTESLGWEIKKICGMCLTKPEPTEVPDYEEPMITQSDFEDYIRAKLEKSVNARLTLEPEVCMTEIVRDYITDHDMSETDRGTQMILGRRFAEFVNSSGAELFLRVTGGTPLILATE